MAITWYPEKTLYSDQCYLFEKCDTHGYSNHDGQVWHRGGAGSTSESTFFHSFEFFLLLIFSPCIVCSLWTWCRRLRRRRRRTAVLVLVPPPRLSTEPAAVVEQSVQSAIEVLPYAVWDADATDLDDNATLCSLCLQNYERGEEVTVLPGCGHRFHKACVTTWLGEAQRGKKRRCPLCNVDPLATPTATPSSPPAPV